MDNLIKEEISNLKKNLGLLNVSTLGKKELQDLNNYIDQHSSLPDDIYLNRMEKYERREDIDITKEEQELLLQLRQTNSLRLIEGCIVFNTAVVIAFLIFDFIKAITGSGGLLF